MYMKIEHGVSYETRPNLIGSDLTGGGNITAGSFFLFKLRAR